MKEGRRCVIALSILFSSWAHVASAGTESAAPIKLEMVVQKEITITDKGGVPKVQLVEPKLVVPGDEVIYTIRYKNVGQEPTSSVVVTNKIPEQMKYVRGSAGGQNADVLFSVDGTEFAARDLLKVRTPDGQLRPAADEDLTHIRWIVSGDLLPGKGGTVAYRARLQ